MGTHLDHIEEGYILLSRIVFDNKNPILFGSATEKTPLMLGSPLVSPWTTMIKSGQRVSPPYVGDTS